MSGWATSEMGFVLVRNLVISEGPLDCIALCITHTVSPQMKYNHVFSECNSFTNNLPDACIRSTVKISGA